MSVTGTTHRRQRRRWREDSGGCIHDEIAEHFPELAPLIKWHLCSQEKGPMHYVANAQYWASIAAGLLAPSKYGPDPAAAFESTVVFGAVEGDELPWSDWPEHDNDATDRERRAELDARVKAWCEARFDALMAAFHAAWADRVPDDQLGA